MNLHPTTTVPAPQGLRPAALLLMTWLLLAGCAMQPQPLTEQEIEGERQRAQALLGGISEPMGGPLTLPEAMARALKYNLDKRVHLMEEALARGRFELALFDLLPEGRLQAGASHRSNRDGGEGETVPGGEKILPPTTFSGRNNTHAELSFTWSVLDWGLSHARAKQQADRHLIMNERRRQVIHELLMEVRGSWWKTVAATHLEEDLEGVLASIATVLERSRHLESTRTQDPMQALTFQRALTELEGRLLVMRRQLRAAKVHLAGLMGIRPGTPFRVAMPDLDHLPLPYARIPLDTMERIALFHRPELRERDYEKRIAALELKKAYLSMLPNPGFDLGLHWDNNKLLYNQNWAQAGLNVSWSLFNLFNHAQVEKYAASQEALAESQWLAMHMAVLTQVHLAFGEFQSAREIHDHASRLEQINRRMYDNVKTSVAADAMGEFALVENAATALLARMNQLTAFADLQTAFGRLHASLGVDPLPGVLPDDSLDTIGRALANHYGDVAMVLKADAPSAHYPPGVTVIELPPLVIQPLPTTAWVASGQQQVVLAHPGAQPAPPPPLGPPPLPPYGVTGVPIPGQEHPMIIIPPVPTRPEFPFQRLPHQWMEVLDERPFTTEQKWRTIGPNW